MEWWQVAFGATIGWMLHSMWDSAWEMFVKPRLIRHFERDFDRRWRQ